MFPACPLCLFLVQFESRPAFLLCGYADVLGPTNAFPRYGGFLFFFPMRPSGGLVLVRFTASFFMLPGAVGTLLLSAFPAASRASSARCTGRPLFRGPVPRSPLPRCVFSFPPTRPLGFLWHRMILVLVFYNLNRHARFSRLCVRAPEDPIACFFYSRFVRFCRLSYSRSTILLGFPLFLPTVSLSVLRAYTRDLWLFFFPSRVYGVNSFLFFPSFPFPSSPRRPGRRKAVGPVSYTLDFADHGAIRDRCGSVFSQRLGFSFLVFDFRVPPPEPQSLFLLPPRVESGEVSLSSPPSTWALAESAVFFLFWSV